MTQLSLFFLGRFQVTLAGKPLVTFESDRVRALLAFLAVEADRPHRRDQLAALFWPNHPEATARANLRHVLRKLRQALGEVENAPAWLLTTRQTIQFNPASPYTLDVARFQELRALCQAHPHPDPSACVACAERLNQAVALYEGNFLAGLSLPGSIALEEWVLLNQERLHRQAVAILTHLANYHETHGNFELAATLTRRQVELEPWREEAHRQLMRVLAAAGQRRAALAQYESCCRILAAELGVEPTPETTALYERIRVGGLDRGNALQVSPAPLPLRSPTIDWGEAPPSGAFYGRQAELARLERWLITERCRLVALLGMGGIGKTSLAAHLARSLADQFEVVYWRSLVNAPSLPEVLRACLQFLAGQTLADLPTSLDEQLALLVNFLRQRRCLLVLDNLETVMQSERAGSFKPDYEIYHQLLRRIAQNEHQSCLLLTSRERPQGLAQLAEDVPLVRSLQLSGVTAETGRVILEKAGLSAPVELSFALVARYSGNALALKLVARTLQELFDGDMTAFLSDETPIFDDIQAVLDEQFARLTPLEYELMVWLAVEREAISYQALAANLVSSVPQRALLEALRALQRRSLLEKAGDGFALQNVVLEYTTERLISGVCREIEAGLEQLPGSVDQGAQISPLFNSHALLKAQAKAYVRLSQTRLIVQPIAERLLARLGKPTLVKVLRQRLAGLRANELLAPGYAAGNLLNLLLVLEVDVSGYDFSGLNVRQAYLRGKTLQQVNFAQANLLGSVFTDTFSLINWLAFSPDGQLLAAAAGDGEIRLWRLQDSQPVVAVKGHSSFVSSVAFSPDGETLASGSDDHSIRLWAVVTASGSVTLHLRHTLTGHTDAVNAVAFSPDGQTLASGSLDHTIHLWDVARGELCHALTGHTGAVWSVAFSPDGETLASGSDDLQLRLWAVARGELRHTLAGHTKRIYAVAFSPDGTRLASGSVDQTVQLWQVNGQTGQLRHTLRGHTHTVRSIAFSPDGTRLASGGYDETIRLWDVASGQPVYALRGHNSWIRSVAFSPDGQTLASGSLNSTIHLWDVTPHQAGQIRHTLQGYANLVRSVAFSPDGALLASGHDDQTVRLWSVNHQGEPDHSILQGHTNLVRAVAFSPDGQTLATGSFDHTVRLWNPYTGQARFKLQGHTNLVRAVAFSPDGALLASGSWDQTIHLWEVRTGQVYRILRSDTGQIYAIAFSPVEDMLVSSHDDHLVRLWDVQTGQLRHTWPGHNRPVKAVAVSPDGRTVASGGDDRIVHLWDPQSGEIRQSLPGHTDFIWSLAFSPDGETLASSSSDHTVRLWNVRNGQLRHTLQGHTDWVWSVAFSPDGRTLVSSSGDKTIRLWEVATGHCRQTWRSRGPYAGMNISGVTGLTPGQKQALKALGAVEEDEIG